MLMWKQPRNSLSPKYISWNQLLCSMLISRDFLSKKCVRVHFSNFHITVYIKLPECRTRPCTYATKNDKMNRNDLITRNKCKNLCIKPDTNWFETCVCTQHFWNQDNVCDNFLYFLLFEVSIRTQITIYLVDRSY